MENNLWGYIIAVVIGLALGGFIAYKRLKGKKFKLDEQKVLENIFGETVYARTFTIGEARDWIKARKNLLEQGGKALILKVSNKALNMLGHELELNFDKENEKYLVIAIIQNDENIVASTLIKYDKLNANLEDALAESGSLVVEA